MGVYENLPGFRYHDQHNASSNSNMSWKEFPQSIGKDTQFN